jgi:hypothetical protein
MGWAKVLAGNGLNGVRWFLSLKELLFLIRNLLPAGNTKTYSY